jgi:hypothetical protein
VEKLYLGLALMWMAVAVWLLLAWIPSPDCEEDEAWTAVPYGTVDSFEDAHGVNRACVHLEEL